MRSLCVCVCCVSVTGGGVNTPRLTQYFRGSLSGLTIRPGKIETQKVISCLQACKEGLDINSLESLGKGIKANNKTHNYYTHTHTHSIYIHTHTLSHTLTVCVLSPS